MSEYTWGPSAKQLALLHATARDANWNHAILTQMARTQFGKPSLSKLNKEEYEYILERTTVARNMMRREYVGNQ